MRVDARQIRGDRALWLFPAIILAGILAGTLLLYLNPLWLLATVASMASLWALLRFWPTSGIGLLIASAMLNRYDISLGVWDAKLEHLVVIILALLLASQIALGKRGTVIAVPGLLLLAWLGVEVVASFASPLGLFQTGIGILLKTTLGVLAYLATVNIVTSQKRFEEAFKLFLILGTGASAYGILVWLIYNLTHVNLGIQASKALPVPVPYGTLSEGNIYGSHAMSMTIICITYILARRRGFFAPLRWTEVFLGINFLSLLLSLSRGAWLAFVFAGSIAFLVAAPPRVKVGRRFWLALIGGPLLVATVAFLVYILPEEVPLVRRIKTFATLSEERTVVGRLEKYSLALSSWQERPILGWGAGSMAPLHGTEHLRFGWVGNLAIRVLLDTGALGLLLFCLFVATLLIAALGALRRAPPGYLRTALLSLVLGYLGLLVAYMVTDATLLAAPWIHAGLIGAGSRVVQRPAKVSNES